MSGTEELFIKCAEGVQALLQTVDLLSLFPNVEQVSIGDDSVLGLGADYFAIIHAGPFSKENFSAEDAIFTWVMSIDLFSRYKSEADRNLIVLRDKVNDILTRHRDSLGGILGVTSSLFEATDDVQYVESVGTPNAGPVFKMQRTTLTVTQFASQPATI